MKQYIDVEGLRIEIEYKKNKNILLTSWRASGKKERAKQHTRAIRCL